MQQDFLAQREHILPFPTPADGYTRVQFLGTTGAGKTTLVRQLIGTDPLVEHFPSTAPAKTTTCDLELIIAEGPFKAVVSFLPRNTIRAFVEECVTAAVLAHLEDRKPKDVVRKLLEHSEQRFRLSYILGKLPHSQDRMFEEDNNKDALGVNILQAQPQQIEKLQRYIQEIISIGNMVLQDMAEQSDASAHPLGKEEKSTFLEHFLGDRLHTYQVFLSLVADIMRTIESRFLLLSEGHLAYDEDGWPSYWIYSSEDRGNFLLTVNQFCSNTPSQFGRLLTPLVQGLRVKGPFQPSWREGPLPRLALIDGEGLGHTIDSANSLPTSKTAWFEHADAIVLVDNAQQPMQAAPIEALRAITVNGHVAKLFVCFTHFESVDGDTFSEEQDRIDHVQNSLDNTISALGREIGTYSSAALRNRLEDHVFFLSHMQQKTLPKEVSTQLETLLHDFESLQQESTQVALQPVYEEKNIATFLRQAVFSFREAWQGRLGLNAESTRHQEHWTRIKALAKRLAKLGMDEYDTLRPVADLIREISEHSRQFLDRPQTWEFATYRSEEERQAAIDAIARDIYAQLHIIARQRIILDCIPQWQKAYARSGTGSAKVRADDIELIYRYAAPLPDELRDDDIDAFCIEVTRLIQDAIHAGGGRLL